uniref:Uncharacterized protein n=1 Tax=Solanum tuberosum TaxID=4113 RepID=M1DMD6_SOLTU
MVGNDLAPEVRGQVAPSVVLIEDEQHGASREGASIQSIGSVAKEVELMERDEFGDLKKARTLGVVKDPNLLLHFRIDHQYHRVEA